MISTNIMRVKNIKIGDINRLPNNTFTRDIIITSIADYLKDENETDYQITCFADSEKELEITTTKTEVI